MKRYIDIAGRITLPKGFRDELGIKEGDEVDVEIKENQMIITASRLKTKEEIERQLQILENLKEREDVNLTHLQGYEDALKWTLNEEDTSNSK